MEEGSIWRNLAGGLVTLAIIALAGGYLGWLHPLGDSLAVGRIFAVIAVLVAAVLANMAGMNFASFAASLFAMICGLQVLLAYQIPGPPGRITIYQKNVLFRNAALDELAADIRATGPMVVTLQEVTEANAAVLAELQDLYPAQHYCPAGGVGGQAVLSQLPLVPDTGFCAPGLAAMQVVYNEQRFWIVSVHLHWPWPYQQSDHVRSLLPVLDKLEGPVVIGGDFNMVAWSNALRVIGDISGTQTAGPTVGTYLGFDPWHRLPIDHVLAPSGGRVALRPALGSDHLGLLAGVEL